MPKEYHATVKLEALDEDGARYAIHRIIDMALAEKWSCHDRQDGSLTVMVNRVTDRGDVSRFVEEKEAP